jgi:hypothetical protein
MARTPKSDAGRKSPRKRQATQKKQQAKDEPLKLTTHREFGEATGEIFRRLKANPQALHLLLVNPAMAMQDAGIELSPELRHHVLHVLQHPPALRARRDELEKKLHSELDEQPRPNDPEWVAKTLFKKLKLRPLEIGDRQPVYKSVFSERVAQRAAAKRKKWDDIEAKTGIKRPTTMGFTIQMGGNNIRRLDLDAPAPAGIPYRRAAPKQVPLEQLYFYKDQHPLARDLLELGIIERRAFPIQSADSYRKIKAGEQPNLFGTWISGIRLAAPEEDDDVSDG